MSRAIDLYSGIGGWTLGMKLSGITNVASFEWWNEANLTHNINFNTNHSEIDIRSINVEEDLNYNVPIDFVVGSPPCTQFSYSNKGGSGDIQDGLVDIYKFLEVVEFLRPKYWAMENVPRVAKILRYELEQGSLTRFKDLVKHINVYNCEKYGIPQGRKRMIAGDFPVVLFESYPAKIRKLTLGDIIESLNKDMVIDPIYGYKLQKDEITEMGVEAVLTEEELRINSDNKTYHPIYNVMSFPDSLNKPSRTITATCTRVSRECIVVKHGDDYRRLNVRERGMVQGFPITYQFYGKSLNSKFTMIGNAIPPILTYYIFQSMLEVGADKVVNPADLEYKHMKPDVPPPVSNLGPPKRSYPKKRNFKFCIPGLRW